MTSITHMPAVTTPLRGTRAAHITRHAGRVQRVQRFFRLHARSGDCDAGANASAQHQDAHDGVAANCFAAARHRDLRIERPAIARLLDEHETANFDHSMALWQLLVFEGFLMHELPATQGRPADAALALA